ncbi:ArsA-related P-loop ATPase, partial [Nocardioides sp. J9]|uniref:ArsA-related P-loop ATPase n=1 Tax=Nocardioides sp. J9 TaxID=935844 RepID=UPI0011A72CFD
MRIVLFTGKGGVGKSTVAAGTAALHSLAGRKVGVVDADIYAEAEPTEVAPNLFLQQVDAQLRFEQSWADIQRY